MTVTGMNISNPGILVPGQKINSGEMTGAKGVVDFGSLIAMLSGGVPVTEGRPSLIASSDDKVNQKSTDQLLKLMITSGILSEADGVLSKSDGPDFSIERLNDLGENSDLLKIAGSFLNTPVLITEDDFVDILNETVGKNFSEIEVNGKKYPYSNFSDTSFFPSMILRELGLTDKDSMLGISDNYVIDGQLLKDGLNVSGSSVNTSILADKQTKFLEINHENILPDLYQSDIQSAQFFKVFTSMPQLNDEALEPKIINLSININDNVATLKVFDEKEKKFHDFTMNATSDLVSNNKLILEVNTSEIDTLVTQVKIESSVDALSQKSIPSQKVWPIKSISFLFTDKGADMAGVENKIVPIYPGVVPEVKTQSFVDTNHVVLLEKKVDIEPLLKPNNFTDYTVRLLAGEPNIDPVKGKLLEFVKVDEFDFPVSSNFLEKLSDIQSGRISVMQMKEMLDTTLPKFNISNLTAEGLSTDFSKIVSEIIQKPKVHLKISTADVLSYRQALQKPSVINNEVISNRDSMVPMEASTEILQLNKIEKFDDKFVITNREPDVIERNLTVAPSSNPSNLSYTGEISNLRPVSQTIFVSQMNNALNIYDAQFSSRLGMLLTEKIIQGQENFELQLEPESFGKVRVNVSMENTSVDVKILADNSAALVALRGSENILQGIAEQNGLKLSEYSVDMQNHSGNDNNSSSNGKDKNGTTSMENKDIDKTIDDNSLNPETSHSLNLLA